MFARMPRLAIVTPVVIVDPIWECNSGAPGSDCGSLGRNYGPVSGAIVDVPDYCGRFF